jgi:predicted nucleic acid-binding protein
MVLVDSSVLIDFLNANRYKEEITKLIKNKEMFTTEIIIMEVLQGIKEDKVYEKVKLFLESLPLLCVTYDDHILSANIYRKCRKKGKTIRKSIDCLIASIAIANNVVLFANDKDFTAVQACFPLKLYKIK